MENFKKQIIDNYNKVTFNYHIEGNKLVTIVTGKRTTEKKLYRIAIHHNWDCGIKVEMDDSIMVNNKLVVVYDANTLDNKIYGFYSENEISVTTYTTIK